MSGSRASSAERARWTMRPRSRSPPPLPRARAMSVCCSTRTIAIPWRFFHEASSSSTMMGARPRAARRAAAAPGWSSARARWRASAARRRELVPHVGAAFLQAREEREYLLRSHLPGRAATVRFSSRVRRGRSRAPAPPSPGRAARAGAGRVRRCPAPADRAVVQARIAHEVRRASTCRRRFSRERRGRRTGTSSETSSSTTASPYPRAPPRAPRAFPR